ncbi:MAG: molybdenum cofactor guanylyltransferase [Elusimicrobia bacterium]|nr:molybdenum cofactor guanylyltransferase [Elusimicrobiota bacterium]
MKDKNISAVILAGGKNTRFSGYNKALLKIGKERIIDIMLGVLENIFSEIIIVTNNSRDFSEFNDINIVSDIIKNCGPLGGIYTGLKTINTEYAFFVACDMPYIDKNLIGRIIKRVPKTRADCVVPYTHKGMEPLFAAYSKKIAPYIEESLKKREFSVNKTVSKFFCEYIKLNEKEELSVFSINTPKDMEQR